MKSHTDFFRCLVLATALALPMGVAAAEPEVKAEAPKADAPTATAVKKKAVCDTRSGSRIRSNMENGCAGPKPYRSYSMDELQRTGEIDMAEALRKTDPIFQ